MKRKDHDPRAARGRTRTPVGSLLTVGLLGLLLLPTITGTAVAAPAVSSDPRIVDFGLQTVGSTSVKRVTLRNSGDALLRISAVSIGGDNAGDFTIVRDTGGLGFAPGGLRNVDVQFKPGAAGSRVAFLQVTSSAPGSPSRIPLTGVGTTGAPVSAPAPTPTSATITAGDLTVAPATLAFGDQAVGTVGSLQTVTITNKGNSTLPVMSVSKTGANPDDFLIVADTGETSLSPNASRIVGLRFGPSAAGARSAALSISTSAPGSPTVVALTGTGAGAGTSPGKG